VVRPALEAERIRETSGLRQLPEAASPSPVGGAEQIRTRVAWLLFFRGAVLSALLISAMLVNLGEGSDLLGPALVAIYVTCGASFGVILVSGLWLRTYGSRYAEPFAYVQLIWDSVVAAVLALLTGGVDSAFIFLFFLTVLNAAAVLGRRATIVLALVNFILYLGILGAQVTGIGSGVGVTSPHSLAEVVRPLLVNNLGMFLVAALAGYLTDQLQQTSESLTETRAQLSAIEELYAAVLHSVPSGILTVDESGAVVYVNPAGAEIFGAVPAELNGVVLDDLMPGLDVTSSTPGERFEVTLEENRVLGGSIAELAGDAELAGRVIVYQELTELRQLQQDVARADRLATVGRFAAGLAHEIRNPLASMVGCLQLLQIDAEGEDDESRMVRIVRREAERLDGLVSEFLTFARPAPPELRESDLRAIVQETVEAMAAGDAADIEVVAPDPVPLRCDPERIRQVLWNLLNNAVSSAGAGSKVRVSAHHEGAFATLIVEDNGPGVPKESRGQIFEPFFTTRPRGTGLGLAVCHQIVSGHHGRLRVKDSDLGGARFDVALPIDPERPNLADPSTSGAWLAAG
jgi:two-component system sensor histidine kinase PilS (NtrC family)